MEFLFIALVLLLVPFVLPVVTWVAGRRTRWRLDSLEESLVRHRDRLYQLEAEVRELRQERRVWVPPAAGQTAPPSAAAEASSEAARSEPPVEPLPAAEAAPQPERGPEPGTDERSLEPPPAPQGRPSVPTPETEEPVAARVPAPPDAAVFEAPPEIVPVLAAAEEGPPPHAPAEADARGPGGPEEPPAGVPAPPFDWESLVGVKLFSAVAGIALVLAAILFLRYSIEHGWLQPPVRVAIGVLVALALLVACELKAARRYPVTANALDAAAIAILFSTFFAAHALWDLIPAPLTFGLLALVTALAVLLSIRRESLFIAVLGLLGGFSTPALLSTGENRPVPLFAYLLLLNIGLAWVALRKGWSSLSWLTLVLTTVYQWGWVLRFLDESSLSLAMGVFIVFPLASMGMLAVARRREVDGPAEADGGIGRTSLVSAALPLAFAAYLAAVPEYGPRAGLLFGFLLVLDCGLLAIALARREEMLHVSGAVATLVTTGTWLAVSYPGTEARLQTLAFVSAAVALYLFAPVLATRLGRPFSGPATRAHFAAPLLVFAFPVLAAVERTFAAPWPLFATLLAVVLATAWRAIASRTGALYWIAAFFAVAAQAVWSAAYLVPGRLGTAIAVYLTFAAVSLGTPILARHRSIPLKPAWGAGVVLLLSLGLLLFLSTGSVAPAALWALALLLAILNAAVFIESAAGGLPLVSQAGTILSWIVLASWWWQAAGAVGVLPSLAVLTGLALVTLGGHAWSARQARTDAEPATGLSFGGGLYLGLCGHLFLLFLAPNPEWSQPPWPFFGALLVVTLATSAASLAVRAPVLHAAGTVAAAVVVGAWGASLGPGPWPFVALLASAAVSGYALGWILLPGSDAEASARGALATIVVSEFSLIAWAGVAVPLPFWPLAALHAGNMAMLLALAVIRSWRLVAAGASALAWVAVLHWQESRLLFEGVTGGGDAGQPGLWPHLLLLAGLLYGVFLAYPFAVARRRTSDREPYLAAIVASAMLFFAARSSLRAGDLESVLGLVPVVEGALLALLLRQLLRIEPPGERDLGRLALVAGAALGFATVAIPVQLERQWITIGWALEGTALAWLYRRVPHKGLLYASVGLLLTVFVRLALNPEVLVYEPRGPLPILNWYLYTYLVTAGCCIVAGWWLARTDDSLAARLPKPSGFLPALGVVLLFLLLNIEIADYYATEPTLTFRFGVTVSQDLTYTLGWLVFGMLLLGAGIWLRIRAARVAAVGLIAVTTFKCFLYDLGSLEGLYRVVSFVGLALALALVSLALQKYVLRRESRQQPGIGGSA
ncbi:MAG TPA: DUF2339 domain-containing protein [Vicinamibacterales bacterium]|nr:DUF2339 domain-containing protein [Vicinamibacterales bacterium]